jgi:outer membrane protein assembly factor BamB
MRSTNCTSSFPDDYQTLFRLYTKLLAHSSHTLDGDPALFLPPSAYIDTETRDTMLVMGASGAEKDSTSAYYYKAYLAQYNLTKRRIAYLLLQQEGYATGTTGTLAPNNIAVILNNQVYTAIGKSIQCNDLLSGRIIWRTKFSSNFYFSRIVQADNRIICNGDDDGIMYALDINDGKIIWETKTTTASGDMFVMNGVAYMVGLGDGRLHAIDIQSGKRIWWLVCPDKQTNGDSSFEDAVTGDGQYVYVRSRLNLYCFKAAK